MGIIGKVVAGAIIVAVGYSLFHLATTHGPIGSERLIGHAGARFAAPLAGSGLVGDANLYTKRKGKIPAACDVTEKGAFVSCRDLTGDAVLVFWETGENVCVKQVTALNAFAAQRRGKVNVVAVVSRPAKGQVEKLIAANHWTVPIAIDRDGALGSVYDVGACPTTFFLHDGVVTGVRIGLMNLAQLTRAFAAAGPTH